MLSSSGFGGRLSYMLSFQLWEETKAEAMNTLYHPWILQLATTKLPKVKISTSVVLDLGGRTYEWSHY